MTDGTGAADAPVVSKVTGQIWYEDFVPGTVLTSAPRVITAEDIDAYARLTGEDHPVHMDADFARAAGFAGRITHGLFNLALIEGLKSGHIAGAALDVYEDEAGVFYTDRSEQPLQDDVLARLMSFPNVIVTSHMAYLTDHALRDIADTTLRAFTAFEKRVA